jgi:Asp-tRNAAsn/Glu-tRNAGln amidotransferase A subunit and related amidases
VTAHRTTQPHDLTALEQAAALRRGELSAVELVEHHLRRIDDLDATLGAFVTVTADAALEQAREADVALAAGDDRPLLGVPTAIKDLAMTAGVRTTFGSPVYADFVPQVDDDAARLLRAAGTISLGKTATPEFGLPPYTEPAGRPPAVTPWDTGRLAGGSSGGAAAATAGGLVPFAHATDGGGSIRIPAACCGLVGLKTTRGLVSRGRSGATRWACRCPGRWPAPSPTRPRCSTRWPCRCRRALSAARATGETYLAHARRAEPGRLRIGRYATPPVPDTVVDPACLAAYEKASTQLAELGHEVVEFDARLDPDFLAVFEVLWAVLAHGHPVPAEAEPLLAPLTRWWRARGSAISGPAYLAATQSALVETRRVVGTQVAAGVDVVLTPMLAQLPRPVGWFTAGGDPAQDFERQKRFTPFTATYNISGQPALSLPVAWGSEDGGVELPVSVQLVGLAGADAQLLALGAQLAAADSWCDRHPPTW